jgi:hypothetical protein
MSKIDQEGCRAELASIFKEAQVFLDLQEKRRQEELRRKLISEQKEIFSKLKESKEENALNEFVARMKAEEYASELQAEIEEAQSIAAKLKEERIERERQAKIKEFSTSITTFLRSEDETFDLKGITSQITKSGVEKEMQDIVSQAQLHQKLLVDRRSLINRRLSELQDAIKSKSVEKMEECVETITADNLLKFCEKSVMDAEKLIRQIKERNSCIEESRVKLCRFVDSTEEENLKEEIKAVEQADFIQELKAEYDLGKDLLRRLDERRQKISHERASFSRRMKTPSLLEEWLKRIEADESLRAEFTDEIKSAQNAAAECAREEAEVKTLQDELEKIPPHEDDKLAEWIISVQEKNLSRRLSQEMKRAQSYIDTQMRRRSEERVAKEQLEKKKIEEERERIENEKKAEEQRRKVQELMELRELEEKQKKLEEEQKQKALEEAETERKRKESETRKRKESESRKRKEAEDLKKVSEIEEKAAASDDEGEEKNVDENGEKKPSTKSKVLKKTKSMREMGEKMKDKNCIIS